LIGANSISMDQVMLKLDEASGYGEQLEPRRYWHKDRFAHIND
jgi:hypothetical protein